MAVVIRRRRRRLRPQTRIFRDRLNPLDCYNDKEFQERLRLDRPSFNFLLNEIEEDLEHCTNRSFAIPASLQLCIALRYFASGSFFSLTADVHGVSKSSVCRIVHRVASAISKNQSMRIEFPLNEMDQRDIKVKFAHIGFPNTLGIIDGTHIRIAPPSGERERFFVNRKMQHSINCQIVCDADSIILNAVVKWPGSTHDAFIWDNCALHDYILLEWNYHK